MKETKLNVKLKNCFNKVYPEYLCENQVATRFLKDLPDLFGIYKGLSYRIECKMLIMAKRKPYRYLIKARDKEHVSGLTNGQAAKIMALHNSTGATFICYYKYVKARHKDNGLYLIPTSEIMINENKMIEDFRQLKPKKNWERYWVPCKNGIGFDISKVFEREMKLHYKKIERMW